ncbi:MAG: DUF3696 domain-containing protein, partial [Chloroflexota bacterium]
TDLVVGVSIVGLIPDKLQISVNRPFRELEGDIHWLINSLENYLEKITSKNEVQLQNSNLIEKHRLSLELQLFLSEFRLPSYYKTLVDYFKYIFDVRNDSNEVELVRTIMAYIEDTNALRDFTRRLLESFYSHIRAVEHIERVRSNKQNIDYETALFPLKYREVFGQIIDTFTNQFYYLGPIRAEPAVIYSNSFNIMNKEVGAKGKYTAEILDKYRNVYVRCPMPPDSNFSGKFRIEEVRLIEAVKIWLDQMGLVEDVDTEEVPKIGYRLTVNSPGYHKALDLLNVGVGVSQVLPTLVQALLMDEDCILLLEQPELHLHPKVHSVLADFLLGITTLNKQVIVETHSEYLIHRLRLRIVESVDQNILRSIRMYFVEKEEGCSQFRDVEPNEYGVIKDWPKNFFDTSETELSTIIHKQMQKRERERRSHTSKKG